MRKELLDIIERVRKNKATGIIFNIPREDAETLESYLIENDSAVVIRGRVAPTSKQFFWRLGNLLKVKHLTCCMIPAALNGRIILISEADILRPSFNKAIEDCFNNKVPLLLLMNNNESMKEFRRLPAYDKVLTIEQSFTSLN
jgi:hypothetical protein